MPFDLDPILLANTDLGASLLEEWAWLPLLECEPLFFTALGDAFLRTRQGAIQWLSTPDGKLVDVATSEADLARALREHENRQRWLEPNIVIALRERGLRLGRDECYGFALPPSVGGDFSLENRDVSDVRIHFSLLGQLHVQNRLHKDGAPIRAFIERDPA